MKIDPKLRSTLATIGGVLAIPVAALVLYGGYFVFTYKPKPKPPEPKIDMFRVYGEAKPEEKGAAKGAPKIWVVELVWETEYADEVTIDQGIGKVDAKGSRKVEIDKNTKFTMTAKNVSGEIKYEYEVEVAPPQ